MFSHGICRLTSFVLSGLLLFIVYTYVNNAREAREGLVEMNNGLIEMNKDTIAISHVLVEAHNSLLEANNNPDEANTHLVEANKSLIEANNMVKAIGGDFVKARRQVVDIDHKLVKLPIEFW